MRRFLLAFMLLSFTGWSQPSGPHTENQKSASAESSPPQTRDFLGYLQGLGPLIAAVVAIGVASMQYYLQRQQMKQALFDKRFEAYTAVEAYLMAVNTDDADSQAALFRRFDVASRHAKLLFGPEVKRFIDDFLALDYERKGHTAGDDFWCEATLDLTRRITDELENIFRPYLQLHLDQNWLSRMAFRIDRWVNADQPSALASRYKNAD